MESAAVAVARAMFNRVPAQRRVITLAFTLFLTPSCFFSVFEEFNTLFWMTELAAGADYSMFAGTRLIVFTYSRTPSILSLVLDLLSWVRRSINVVICMSGSCDLLGYMQPTYVATCSGRSCDLRC